MKLELQILRPIPSILFPECYRAKQRSGEVRKRKRDERKQCSSCGVLENVYELAEGRGGPWFVVFAHFPGVIIPTISTYQCGVAEGRVGKICAR